MDNIALNQDTADTTILVVDDDRISRLTIRKVLEQSGYQIITAENGEKAIEQCLLSLPDLVLLDLIMPGLDGFQTCAAIRNLANYNLLPILMLTGLDDMESIDKAFQSGATDFITKPLNWPLLSQRVRYALRTRDLFNQLNSSQKKLSKAQTIARIGYWEYNPQTEIIQLSGETSTLLSINQTNFHIDEFLKRLSHIERLEIRSLFDNTLDNGKAYSIDHSFTTDYGLELTLNQQAELSNHSNNKLLVGTFQDITERVEAEKKIYFHRYFDADTSLPNKDHMLLQLNNVIDDQSFTLLCGVLAITFDKLRSIGSMIGHEFVGEFLKSSSERIIKNINEVREVTRLSNNSVGLIVSNIHTIDQLENICKLLIELFRNPVEIDQHEYHTTLSIGVSIYPYDDEANNILNNAITAQKKCIAEGGSKFLFYHKEMDNQANEFLVLESKMRKALNNNEFVAFFQPQIDTASNSITGMEALARWIDEDGNLMFPDRFIPLAEETEMIIELGKHILFQACEFAQQLYQNKLGAIRTGVNLSAMQFADKNLIPDIKQALESSGLKPELLEIEITESIAMTDISHAVNTLSRIRDMGIKTSMDDFGTGYSSLSYLQQLPLDTLKIDQSFIRPIGPNGENSEIARAIIAMGRSLKMHLIAEGAEEAHHYQFLIDQGCDEVQGYYFSKPVSAANFKTFVKNFSRKNLVNNHTDNLLDSYD